LRDARMKLLMHRLIQRAIHLLGQLIDTRGQLLQLATLARHGDLCESDGGLHLERFADDVMSLHVFR